MGRFARGVTVLLAIALLAASAASAATPTQIYRDYQDNGRLDGHYSVADLQAFEAGLYAFIDTRHSDVFRGIVEKKVLDDTLKKGLDAAVKEFTAEFSGSKATAA